MAVVEAPPARPVHVYVPAPPKPALGAYVRRAWGRRELAAGLSTADVRAQHLNTYFGLLWLVLNPLLLAGVYLILIDILRKGARPEGFLAHLVACVFVYQLVSDSLRSGLRSIVDSRGIILNSTFPRVLLPVSCVLTALRRFFPCFVVFIPIFLLCDRPIGPWLLWVFPLLALFVAFCLGGAMLAGATQVYFRDLKEFLPYLIRVGLFVSPILYLPRDAGGAYEIVLNLNPVGQLMTAWSDVLYAGQAPSAESLAVGSAWALGTFAVGLWVFMTRESEFAVRL